MAEDPLTRMADSIFFLLSRETRQFPVTALHLGAVGDEIQQAGVITLGDLLGRLESDSAWVKGISRLRGVAMKRVERRVQALAGCLDASGNIDWSRFDVLCGDSLEPEDEIDLSGSRQLPQMELVPSRDTLTGDEFLASFPEVIGTIVRTRSTDADRLIFTGRIATQSYERQTLAQVAALLTQAVTRERIRQREKKLLSQLSDAFLLGRCRRFGVQLQPEFVGFWKRAANHFAGLETVDFGEFVAGLKQVWGVPVHQLFAHLPLITAILTSRATIPDHIRSHLKRDSRIFRIDSDSVRRRRISEIPCGKAVDLLRTRGIRTVGELLDALESGMFPYSRSEIAVEVLIAALAAGVADNDTFDWDRVAEKLGAGFLPARDPTSPDEFLAELAGHVKEIIEANRFSVRAPDVYSLRIAIPRSRRPTLAAVASKLRTHGPSIKREESILLSSLNDQLVDGDMSASLVSISPRFHSFWKEANEVFKRCDGHFEQFCIALSQRWMSDGEMDETASEVLWAVLSQYPGGRPKRGSKRVRLESMAANAASPLQANGGLVVLRGFRRVH